MGVLNTHIYFIHIISLNIHIQAPKWEQHNPGTGGSKSFPDQPKLVQLIGGHMPRVRAAVTEKPLNVTWHHSSPPVEPVIDRGLHISGKQWG